MRGDLLVNCLNYLDYPDYPDYLDYLNASCNDAAFALAIGFDFDFGGDRITGFHVGFNVGRLGPQPFGFERLILLTQA